MCISAEGLTGSGVAKKAMWRSICVNFSVANFSCSIFSLGIHRTAPANKGHPWSSEWSTGTIITSISE